MSQHLNIICSSSVKQHYTKINAPPFTSHGLLLKATV